jgi:hypothetical protein
MVNVFPLNDLGMNVSLNKVLAINPQGLATSSSFKTVDPSAAKFFPNLIMVKKY